MAIGKKKASFVHIVGIMTPIIATEQGSMSDRIFDVLGKAWKVTDTELMHQHGNVSKKAKEFIYYQLYITANKPVWYQGAEINRD